VCLIRILLVAVDGEIPVVVLLAGAISQSVPSLLLCCSLPDGFGRVVAGIQGQFVMRHSLPRKL